MNLGVLHLHVVRTLECLELCVTVGILLWSIVSVVNVVASLRLIPAFSPICTPFKGYIWLFCFFL
jgi:hypothetical protein